ncbi:3615_t:CDS:1, partial [Acaulospora morrowiae]
MESIREKYRDHEQTVEYLDSFYMRYCPSDKVLDVKDYIQDLTDQKNLWDHISLNETQSPNYFAYHRTSMEISVRVYKYNKSQTFYNVFENRIQASIDGIDVENVAQ